MHRVVLSRKLSRPIINGADSDHINGNGLDNRRENLQEVDHGQNIRNQRRKKENATSSYLGVHRHKRDGKWHARICIPGGRITIGIFTTEMEAMMAREKFIDERPELNARSNLSTGAG